MPSPLPRSTTFVSPVTRGTPTAAARRGHRRDDAREVAHREALLENVAGAEEERLGPAHREVVHRPVHGERADVAAREEGGLHDEGVGGEGEPLLPHRHDRAVAERLEVRVAERGGEQRFDEPRGLAAAAAVGQLDDVAVVERRGAAEHRVEGSGGHGSGHRRRLARRRGGSGSTRRRRPRSRPSWPRAGAPACSACRTPGSRSAAGGPGGRGRRGTRPAPRRRCRPRRRRARRRKPRTSARARSRSSGSPRGRASCGRDTTNTSTIIFSAARLPSRTTARAYWFSTRASPRSSCVTAARTPFSRSSGSKPVTTIGMR